MWWIAIRNTAIFAVMTVVGQTVVGLLAAVLVTQPVRGVGFFRVLLYMPQLLSVGVIGLVWVWLLSSQFGVINYVLSFIGIRPINWLGDPNLVLISLSLTTIWWGFGFPMLMYIAGLRNITEHLYEAARIDGASRWQQFRHITWPMLSPTTFFIFVMSSIGSFQVFSQVYMMTPRGGPLKSTMVVVFYLYRKAFEKFEFGYALSAAFVLFIMIFSVTLFNKLYIEKKVHYS